ncbi:MAG: M50 family metallopeptidase [Christensenellales bacterium]
MMSLLAVSFVDVMQKIGYLLGALACLLFMVLIHELGHYTAGKIFKFKINEFSIGFGPKIFSKANKKSGEVFSVRAFPLGGFCAFAGEDQEVVNEGDFNSKPAWQRIIVLASGVLFNYIFAIIFLSIFFMGYGEVFRVVDKSYDFQDTAIVQQFESGDVILEVDGKKAYSSIGDSFSKLFANKDEFIVTVERDGELIELNVTKSMVDKTETAEDGSVTDLSYYGLGINLSGSEVSLKKLGFFESIGHSFVFAKDIVVVSLKSIGSIFTGGAKVSETLGGTFTAISMLAMLTQSGFFAIVYGLGVFSVSLAFMNILPLPALDGSRIVFTLIELIRGKPVNRKVEGIIHTVGLILLFALTILLDVLHFAG